MSSRPRTRLSAALACALLASCASHGSVTLPSFDDVTAAPDAIQNVAAAIVRIETPTGAATGSFISPTGLLLTNNHVLGVGVCPIEGCYAKITKNYQRGSPMQQATPIFVVPKAVDIGLDMAILQAFTGPGAGRFDSPDYLTVDARDPASLLGTHVNIVGHPEDGLKKWTAGEVVSSDGSWIWTTAFILPGSSGSPILDDHGHIVGLIHRAPTGQDLFAKNGVDEYSVGSASSALIAAMSAPLPASMWSIAASVSDADVVSRQLVYLAARAKTATVNGASKPVLTSLAEACDAGLARHDYTSPEDLSKGTEACFDAEAWIECRSDEMPTFDVCPDTAGSDLWLSRYQAIFDYWQAFNGELELDEVSFAPAALSSTKAAGQEAGARVLSRALARVMPPLDFRVALRLAAFGVTYGGKSVVDFLNAYSQVPDYALSGTTIAETALWLNHTGVMSSSDIGSLFNALLADDTIDLSTKLFVESVEYNSGTLQ